MKPAKHHPHAEGEMIGSALFYDERNRGQGERFLKAVEEAETAIGKQPLWGRPYEAGTRRWRVKRFPFVLIYKELPDCIMVFAVAHFSRRPGYWVERL
jgi:toxin ParE1/3/4